MSMTLKNVGDDIRARLSRAKVAGILPDREPDDGYGYVRYDVRVSSGRKSGPKVNIEINGYEWLIPNLAADGAAKRWWDTDGAALKAKVDEVAARDRFTSPSGEPVIGGETKFGMCFISSRATTVTHIDRYGNETVEEIAG